MNRYISFEFRNDRNQLFHIIKLNYFNCNIENINGKQCKESYSYFLNLLMKEYNIEKERDTDYINNNKITDLVLLLSQIQRFSKYYLYIKKIN